MKQDDASSMDFFFSVRKMLSQHCPITSGFLAMVSKLPISVMSPVLEAIVLNYVIYRFSVKTSLN